MQITQLEIYNFRGIKKSDIEFPLDTRLICMIGAGDGTKSTLLKSIEWILWPTWSLFATDADFYNSDTTANIILRGTFTEIPESLLSEEKFGLYLRRNGVPLSEGVDDEPLDDQPVCLTVQLTIDASLEPKWEIVCNRKEPKTISFKDRKLLSVGCVGSNCDKDMIWSRFSVLQKYADSKGVLNEVFTGVLREVASNTNFHQLDAVSTTINAIGSRYGVELSADIKSKLLIQNSGFNSSVGLFEEGAPLSQRGLGSQRLLSMGLNINATTDGAILIVDEVETGLEPYRLKSLINEFRTHSTSGQIIMTTHSPVAVAECTIQELFVIQCNDGITSAYPLNNVEGETAEVIQREVRRNPEAFLCKRLIVCEGKTEIGFVRALDSFMSKKHRYRMACEGVGTAIGGGDTLFACAILLTKCGYDVCIFMDSDLKDKETLKQDAKLEYKIDTYDWDTGNSIEEQLFNDIPKNLAEEILQVAVDDKGVDSINAKLKDIPHEFDSDTIKLSIENDQQRLIGSIAKAKKTEWYKRIDSGEQLGNIVFSNWDSIGTETTLHKTINNLINWVLSDE